MNGSYSSTSQNPSVQLKRYVWLHHSHVFCLVTVVLVFALVYSLFVLLFDLVGLSFYYFLLVFAFYEHYWDRVLPAVDPTGVRLFLMG